MDLIINRINGHVKACSIGDKRMEFWTKPAKGELSRVELVDMKVHNTLFTTFYVQIVSLMKEKYGIEGAIEALRQIGEGVAVTMWNYVKPAKTNSIKAIIADIASFGFYYSIDIKKVIDDRGREGFLLVDKNCPICWEGVIEKDIPYCCIIDGFLEQYLLIARENGYEIPQVQVRVEKSKATGDEACIHRVTIL